MSISNNWNLSLPTGTAGKPTVIEPPVSKYTDVNFYPVGGTVVFKAPCNGVTTPNSTYPRCELRELVAGKLAAWDISKGTHVMTYTASCDHLPKNKPQLVMGQVHGANDDVFEIRFTGPKLEVIHNAKVYGTLLTSYVLGTFITIKATCEKGTVKIECGKASVNFKANSKGCYFKVGCYVQSNGSHGDASDYGQVSLKSVNVVHH